MSLNRPVWKLREWINKDKIYCQFLNHIEEYQHIIHWMYLDENLNAFDILYEILDKNIIITWNKVSFNFEAIQLFKENIDKINLCQLSENMNKIY